MFNKVTIQEDQRGLLFHKGSYARYLLPETYTVWSVLGQTVAVVDAAKPLAVEGKALKGFLGDAALLQDVDVVDVADSELVLRYEDGKFAGVLTSGQYAFWNVMRANRFVRVDLGDPMLSDEVDAAIVPKLAGYVQGLEVQAHETGLLYYNHVLQRELGPGKYVFWRGPVKVEVRTTDLRQQQLDLLGQEMMTEDKITLRLNFVCQYRVTDALKVLQIRSMEDQLYVLLQLILREYVGTMKLDELLRVKEEIAAFVMSRLAEKQAGYGVEFVSAGVKDIILPGEIKDILNTVLYAEKKAQANLITRREETASTRSLLNTAKLMDENQTLYRLKELEFVEKICEKIGHISLTGGGNMLEQMNALFGKK
ncbi:peptidase [Paenibacillus swuensis]|uniref:Peptidase n=1 Tax=Paenibacillus swuensis TaxID=1178515 RepID=A0A172TEM9_9BACL|nr:slipin family protein [Paenibacillus swuensis]ANE45243.1 peptidase [Paenibacillus swuensis]